MELLWYVVINLTVLELYFWKLFKIWVKDEPFQGQHTFNSTKCLREANAGCHFKFMAWGVSDNVSHASASFEKGNFLVASSGSVYILFQSPDVWGFCYMETVCCLPPPLDPGACDLMLKFIWLSKCLYGECNLQCVTSSLISLFWFVIAFWVVLNLSSYWCV